MGLDAGQGFVGTGAEAGRGGRSVRDGLKPCHCHAAGIRCTTGAKIAALINAGKLDDAYNTAGLAVIDNPACWQAHYGFASAIVAQHRAPFALEHLQTAIDLQRFEGREATVPLLYTELGRTLMQSGQPGEASRAFEHALALSPDYLPAKHGLHDAGGKLTAVGDRIFNGHALLDEGRAREIAGDYPAAWDCWSRAKAELRAKGAVYPKDATDRRFAAYRGQCTTLMMEALSRAAFAGLEAPQAFDWITPVFILGYPRSGTTLLEQILSCSARVIAGDELPFVVETVNRARAFTGSRAAYPWCLNELLVSDTRIALAAMRHHYLARVIERVRPTPPDRGCWITDKMPLNECYLPLLHLMFPAAPKILIRRNPLDVLVSNFSLHLTHGLNQANDPVTCADHIMAVDRLVEHYRRKLAPCGLSLLVVDYEELVSAPEPVIRRICDYARIAFDPAMLHPENNTRFCHTASYAQVREPISAKAIGRWRRFAPQLAESLSGSPAAEWLKA